MPERGRPPDHRRWKPEPAIEHWFCRAGCGEMVPVTPSAVERLADSNNLLTARGEQPIQTSEVVWCKPCEERLRAIGFERRARKSAEITRLVGVLRSSMDPKRERVTIARLRELGHPEVDGLVRRLREAIEARFPSVDSVSPRRLR